MNRERKVIKYQFGDFTSPRTAVRQDGNSSRRISIDEQLATVRAFEREKQHGRNT